MAIQAQTDHDTTARASLDPAPVNVRIVISALWTATLFVFVYVDLFSLYRPDFRADIDAGQINGFDVNQTFLLATTAYVVLPALMVVGSLLLPARVARIANIALGPAYALTIIGSAIGEWNYFILGSIVEVALLVGITFHAWTWPRVVSPARRSLAP